jgi:hypothetical protein
MFEKEYTLNNILLSILNKLTINEIVIWIGIIVFLIVISQSMNITILQFLLIGIVLFLILYMNQLKQKETDNLQQKNNIVETNNESLLKFIDSISYFKLYNSVVYSDFTYKVKQYINLLKFADIHEKNQYKLYPKKIIKENLNSQKQNILETFASFEHTIDDSITSIYKLRELTSKLNTILSKSNLIS